MQLTNDQKIVLGSVIIGKLKDVVDEAKDTEKAYILEAYEGMGIKSREIRVGSQKLGSMTVSVTESFDIADYDQAYEYLDSIGMLDKRPRTGWQKRFFKDDDGKVICTDTGEVVTFLVPTTKLTPTVRLEKDEEKIRSAFEKVFGEVPSLMLLNAVEDGD